MDDRQESGVVLVAGRTKVTRTSDREVVVTRRFDAPARIVY